jgi:hypothetical protein
LAVEVIQKRLRPPGARVKGHITISHGLTLIWGVQGACFKTRVIR